MRLSDKRLQEFRELWSGSFGEQLSIEQARHEALLLMELYAMLATPLKSGGRLQIGVEDPLNDP